jgi:hypothetical protein
MYGWLLCRLRSCLPAVVAVLCWLVMMIHFDRHSMKMASISRSTACYLQRLRPAGAAMAAASSLDTCARRPAGVN